jgi:hypothetical protein
VLLGPSYLTAGQQQRHKATLQWHSGLRNQSAICHLPSASKLSGASPAKASSMIAGLHHRCFNSLCMIQIHLEALHCCATQQCSMTVNDGRVCWLPSPCCIRALMMLSGAGHSQSKCCWLPPAGYSGLVLQHNSKGLSRQQLSAGTSGPPPAVITQRQWRQQQVSAGTSGPPPAVTTQRHIGAPASRYNTAAVAAAAASEDWSSCSPRHMVSFAIYSPHSAVANLQVKDMLMWTSGCIAVRAQIVTPMMRNDPVEKQNHMFVRALCQIARLIACRHCRLHATQTPDCIPRLLLACQSAVQSLTRLSLPAKRYAAVARVRHTTAAGWRPHN